MTVSSDVVVSSSDPWKKRVYVYDGRTGQFIHELQSPIPHNIYGIVTSLAAAPDLNGDSVHDIAVAHSCHVFVYDGSGGTLLRSLPVSQVRYNSVSESP